MVFFEYEDDGIKSSFVYDYLYVDCNEGKSKRTLLVFLQVDVDKHPDSTTILNKQKQVDDAWMQLNNLAQKRSLSLKIATEVHKFTR